MSKRGCRSGPSCGPTYPLLLQRSGQRRRFWSMFGCLLSRLQEGLRVLLQLRLRRRMRLQVVLEFRMGLHEFLVVQQRRVLRHLSRDVRVHAEELAEACSLMRGVPIEAIVVVLEALLAFEALVTLEASAAIKVLPSLLKAVLSAIEALLLMHEGVGMFPELLAHAGVLLKIGP